MRELTIPESGAKRKLLDAAEQLFAEKGFESVAVRDVSEAVKMNVASVNYHFGSRAGLLATVILHYATPIHEERLARLETVERKRGGKGVEVEEILAAFIRPLLGNFELRQTAESVFYKLVGRILMDHGESLPRSYKEPFSEVNERFTRAFAKALPEMSAEDLIARFHFIQGALIHLLTQQSLLLQSGKSQPTMEESLERLISFAAVGLREGVAAEVPAEKGPQATFNF